MMMMSNEMPRGSSWPFPLPQGAALPMVDRVGARLRLGLAEGAKQLSPWALNALCLAPGSAQGSSVVPQQ